METLNFNTPYDDVFRTMLADCTKFILPIVNEVFHTNYQGDEEIQFYPNEQLHLLENGSVEKKVTDTHFSVLKDEKLRRYHIECQSTNDGSILVRIFEYDSQIAIRYGELNKNELTVTFPNSALLSLRQTKNMSDAMKLILKTPGGTISYCIPVIKTTKFTIEEIFEKKLYFLIPFHIFVYEKEFEVIENDKYRLKELKLRYLYIIEKLNNLCDQNILTEYEKKLVVTMSEIVSNALAKNHEKIRKGVEQIMGGTILDYEAKRILNDGIRQGHVAGLNEGRTSIYLNMRRNGISRCDAQRMAELTDEQAEKAEESLDSVNC